MTHEQFMQEAIDLAVKNVEFGQGGPFGAVIVKNGLIVAGSGNTVTEGCDPTAHAEINAIREACKAMRTFSLAGYDLYTSCQPCPMCLAASYWARLDHVYYAATAEQAAAAGFDDAFLYEQFERPIGQRRLPEIQIVIPSANDSFELWSSSQNKRHY